MKVYYADLPDGYAAWLEAWQHSTEREPFAHPDYAALFANSGTRACAALYKEGSNTVLYPFLLRQFLPTVNAGSTPVYDIITPYGYGSPVLVNDQAAEATAPSHEEKENSYRGFYDAFARWAAAEGVVCEFVRFSLFSQARRYYYGWVEHNNDNIICDLQLPEDELIQGYDRKVRKNVRRAVYHGMRVEEDANGRRLDDFLEVYIATMRRRRAAAAYYFGRSFFERLLEVLPGQAALFHVLDGDTVVASEMVLYSTTRAYSFMGGTVIHAFPKRPGDLLKVRMMEQAKRQGMKYFVIGGGYRPHDGIFAFKKGFAPNGIVPFYTGKMVFDKEMYRALTGTTEPGEGYFPPYRKPG